MTSDYLVIQRISRCCRVIVSCCRHLIMSCCYHVMTSCCYPAITSRCCHVITSHCCDVITALCCHVIMSQCHNVMSWRHEIVELSRHTWCHCAIQLFVTSMHRRCCHVMMSYIYYIIHSIHCTILFHYTMRVFISLFMTLYLIVSQTVIRCRTSLWSGKETKSWKLFTEWIKQKYHSSLSSTIGLYPLSKSSLLVGYYICLHNRPFPSKYRKMATNLNFFIPVAALLLRAG